MLNIQQVDEKIGFNEAPSMIEALTDNNQRLNGKLENALGKIEVYVKEIRVLVDVLDKTKHVVIVAMISNLATTIEAVVNASTQAIHNACSASAVKRKRNES
ncbi:hypothetical protein E2542_SST28865 [Spatholobus suberectus]|nr:hypothetical protein E2542_SST28865 [Spatholobus suberectus]